MKRTKILLISIVSLLVITITIIILFLCGAFKPKDEFAKIYGVYGDPELITFISPFHSLGRDVPPYRMTYTISKDTFSRKESGAIFFGGGNGDFETSIFDLEEIEITPAMEKVLAHHLGNSEYEKFKKKKLYIVGRTYWLFADKDVFVITRNTFYNSEDIEINDRVGTIMKVKRIKKL